MFINEFFTIHDLPFTQKQKEQTIEYLAHQLWFILTELGMDDHHKTYDPLTIDGHIAHSYVFDLEDGGRHHKFNDIKDLEQSLLKETIQQIKNLTNNEN